MGRKVLTLLFVAIVASGTVSYAQYRAVMSGKIVDGNNKPIAGAHIKVSNRWELQQAISDENGQYYTRLLPEGGYQIDISANGEHLKVTRVYFSPTDELKRYYDFRVNNNKVSLHTEEKDLQINTPPKPAKKQRFTAKDIGDGAIGQITVMEPEKELKKGK